MDIISTVGTSRCEAVVDALRAELGGVLAQRVIEAEAAEFLWESRVRERYLGQHFALDFDGEDAGEDISRIAILSFLGGRWHAGVCLVSGDGCAVDLLWLRSFERREDALEDFARAR